MNELTPLCKTGVPPFKVLYHDKDPDSNTRHLKRMSALIGIYYQHSQKKTMKDLKDDLSRMTASLPDVLLKIKLLFDIGLGCIY